MRAASRFYPARLDYPSANERHCVKNAHGARSFYVAQTERENIRQRQMEGIAAAKLRGVQFGRPRKPVPEGFFHLKERWERKEISSRQAAKELHIAQDTFLRWVHEQNA